MGKRREEIHSKVRRQGLADPELAQGIRGMGANEMVTYIIREEMSYALVPTIFVAAHMAGPTLLRVGNEEMKKQFLPPIARERWNMLLVIPSPRRARTWSR